MKHAVNVAGDQYGGAGVKLLLVLAILFMAAHAGFNYVPVAYNGESFKQEMHTAVVNGFAMPRGNPADMIKIRLQKAAEDLDLPTDAVIEVKQVKGSVQAHAVYSKNVSILPFGLYNYTYVFDHTAAPTGFLTKEAN